MRKTALFYQGETASELIVLCKGAVKVWQLSGGGDVTIIRIMGPGDVIGAVPVLRQVPYPVTATTITDCVLLFWTGSWSTALMERHPIIRANALDFVGRRTEEVVDRLHEMATGRVDQRMAHTLLRLADQTGRAIEGGSSLAVRCLAGTLPRSLAPISTR